MKYLFTFLSLFLSIYAFSQVTANFTASQTSGCDSFSVHFTNLSTGDDLTYYWTFRGWYHSTLANPDFLYDHIGIYDVTLIVTDGVTADTLTMPEFITVFEVPHINFAPPANDEGYAPFTASFQNLCTEGGAPITYCEWDFGDGSPLDTNTNPTHVYTMPDSYDVQLTAYDENECSNFAYWSWCINVLNGTNTNDIYQNKETTHPNPATDQITIEYEIDRTSINIYSIDGSLVYSEETKPGQSSFTWHLDDNSGNRVKSGSYVCNGRIIIVK